MFSMKDSIQQSLRSHVIYKFTCAGCNACYIGYTTRHICTCVREHLVLDKASHIYKPLISSKPRHSDTVGTPALWSFTVLDSATSSFQIKDEGGIKINIKWENPTLN